MYKTLDQRGQTIANLCLEIHCSCRSCRRPLFLAVKPATRRETVPAPNTHVSHLCGLYRPARKKIVVIVRKFADLVDRADVIGGAG